MLKALVEYVVKSLVDSPDQVVITLVPDEHKSFIKIAVAPADVGRVIGKDGQTIRALRSLVAALGPDDKETVVEVVR